MFRYRVVPLWRLDARRMRAELGPAGAPFCVAMRGADEDLVQSLAEEVRTARGLTPRDRQTTMQLLYVVSAVILGDETALRIFHMESLIQDPNVQRLIHYWKDQGRAKGLAEGARRHLYQVLAARSFLVSVRTRKRIDSEADVARLEAWLEAAVTARTVGDIFRGR